MLGTRVSLIYIVMTTHFDTITMAEESIDYVIVINKSIKETGKFQYIVRLINHLQKQGLKLRIQHGTIEDNVYITVHLTKKAIPYYSFKYDIDVSTRGHTYLHTSTTNLLNFRFLQTPVCNELFCRDGDTLTSRERIQITNAILNEAKFGEYENDYGVDKLIRFEIATTAYPLHDGNVEDESGGRMVPENDRQKLLKYWASFSMWYKEQPINLIEKYYGSEVAFYFAWMGFYNKMLIPAAFVGVVCSIVSVVYLLFMDPERVKDICHSQIMMCPRCHYGTNCVFKPLNLSCNYAKISIVFDNKVTVFFAVFMSFWATIFVNLWRRRENTLKIRWNVEFWDLDSKFRMAYRDTCTHKQWSPLTGRLEPYIPMGWKFTYIIISHAVCLLILFMIGMLVFSGVMYRVAMHTVIRKSGSDQLHVHGALLLPATSAWLTVVQIKAFGNVYSHLARWLTDLENPRTQTEYDYSVIQKRTLLACANNYAGLFYIAFMKGRYFLPYKGFSWTEYEIDTCNPTGCMMSLCLQLCTLMLFQSLFSNVLTLILPFVKKTFFKSKARSTAVPRWESDFHLEPVRRYFMTKEYLEMVVQYGFVTFFVAAFPLAPFCALINNFIELRLDAYKLVTRYRRPIPRQHSGIGAWNGILRIMTHLSVATNALVLAFTTDFVVREMYKDRHGSLDGYIKSRISLYDLRDFTGDREGSPIAHNPEGNSTLCYYSALRYPPTHPMKYELKPEYWYQTGMRLLCVIIFEHVILVTNGVLSYFIPVVPQSVRETLHYNRTKEMENKYNQEPAPLIRKRTTQLKFDQSSSFKSD